MVSPLQKRLFIVLIMSFLFLFIIRYLFFHDDILAAIKASTEEYKRTANMPVLVTVYYEALCGDSKHFIIKQLLPAFQQASPIMEVQLVPYGKAKTSTTLTGSYRFECQHGQIECEANMYHACAIEAIQKAEDRINMVACMIHDNRNPKEALHNCAEQLGIDNIELIFKCFDSSHGAELLKFNGDQTHSLRPPVTFIPTVTLDGGQHLQTYILKDLLGEVCKIIGKEERAKEFCY